MDVKDINEPQSIQREVLKGLETLIENYYTFTAWEKTNENLNTVLE